MKKLLFILGFVSLCTSLFAQNANKYCIETEKFTSFLSNEALCKFYGYDENKNTIFVLQNIGDSAVKITLSEYKKRQKTYEEDFLFKQKGKNIFQMYDRYHSQEYDYRKMTPRRFKKVKTKILALLE